MVPVETPITVPPTVPTTLPIMESAPLDVGMGPMGWAIGPKTANQIPTKKLAIWTQGEKNLLDHKLCGHRLD